MRIFIENAEGYFISCKMGIKLLQQVRLFEIINYHCLQNVVSGVLFLLDFYRSRNTLHIYFWTQVLLVAGMAVGSALN